jgi:hypothetical protein
VRRVERLGVLVEWPVHGVDDGQVEPVRDGEGRVPAVVVDQIERTAGARLFVEHVERAAHVIRLEQRPLDRLRMRFLEHRPDLGLRPRAGRAEELDVVAAVDQRVGQQCHHLLDPAVARWRDGDPRRRQHRDPAGVLGAAVLGPSGRRGLHDVVLLRVRPHA